ncbi:MAG: ABC transporter ATP-binding protein [Candidatus Odinarchaeota archaeon]|nr:ABC transporter ATP-binding protein [Candidatus Odinarchaeota archaeon]
MTFIEIKNLTKVYHVGKQEIKALQNVDLSIEEREFVAIFGPSGSGKTTLLLALCGLIKPTQGEVIIDGTNITKLKDNEAALWRRRNTGFVFQKINLLSFLNVLDNVLLPLYPADVNKDDVTERALNLIKAVGLEERINHKPAQLSVGEQQRVALARALIGNPKIVFADEPTAHLDTETGKSVIMLMKKLKDEYKTTFIVATHDPEMGNLADRIIKIRDGRILNKE